MTKQENGNCELTNFMDDNSSRIDFTRLAAFQELQEARTLKKVNMELLEHLMTSFRWLIHFCQKNHIRIPEEIGRILDETLVIADKIPQNFLSQSSPPPPHKNQHDFKHVGDSTTNFYNYFEVVIQFSRLMTI